MRKPGDRVESSLWGGEPERLEGQLANKFRSDEGLEIRLQQR